ncbi:MAG TPA: GNAT family N-acetyltransferase [Acidobacteriaceae bacterium]|nr:GNAT family N-acetyltransferase [Acidobacteriaceae bacterium]
MSPVEVNDRPDTRSSFARVTAIDPFTDPRWEAFVLRLPQATIYHHPAWLQVLQREYAQAGAFLACEDRDGSLLGIFPLLYTKGLPIGGGPLTAPRLSSLPRTPLAGPLAVDSAATVALLEEARNRVAQRRGMYLQIKASGGDLTGLAQGVVAKPWRFTYLLALPESSAAPFRISNSQNRASIRRAINKAAANGVQARLAENEADVRAWYSLYLETMRRNVVPPRPLRLFLAMWQLLRPLGMMRLLLAEQVTPSGAKILGGCIYLLFGSTCTYAFGASGTEDLSLRPNDLVQWQAINDAVAEGYRVFDFGEVPEGDANLARYKAKWGAEPVRLQRCYYPDIPDDDSGGDDEKPSRAHQLASAVWRRLPLRLTAWTGDRLYARL